LEWHINFDKKSIIRKKTHEEEEEGFNNSNTHLPREKYQSISKQTRTNGFNWKSITQKIPIQTNPPKKKDKVDTPSKEKMSCSCPCPFVKIVDLKISQQK
jgi:hypothetical protein